MLNIFTFTVSFITVLFIHFVLFNSTHIKTEQYVIAQKPTIIPIALRKVHITQKEIKKIEPKVVENVEPQLTVKPKPIIKKPKIVKESKRKVQKEVTKKTLKIVKKKPKKIEKKVPTKITKNHKKEPVKIVKKEQPKLIKTVTKRLPPINDKKNTVSQTAKNSIKNEYLLKLRALIEVHKKYPKRAKRLNQQGKVIVAFKINKNGQISSIKLKSKSRYKRLNNAALDILRKIVRFEPIPDELEKTQWTINIPISYFILNT